MDEVALQGIGLRHPVPPSTSAHHDEGCEPLVPCLRRPVSAPNGRVSWPAKRTNLAPEQHDGIELHGINIASARGQVYFTVLREIRAGLRVGYSVAA
jgi:hypothetical protein